MPISDCWPALEPSLELLDPPTRKRITSLHEHLSPYSTHIANYATSLHKSQLPCRLITSTYTWGQSFLVYELVFEDGTSWVARFALPPYEGDEFFNTPEQLERKILNEVGVLRVVKEQTAVPVPDIFGFCARHGEDFQRLFNVAIADEGDDTEEARGKRRLHPLGEDFPAFIMMFAMRGKTIEDCGIPIHELGGHWDTPTTDPSYEAYLNSPILRNYLTSLASIHVQLSQITFPQIGSFTLNEETDEVKIGPMAEFGLGPFDSAEEYYGVMAEAFKRIAEGTEEDEDECEDEINANADSDAEQLSLPNSQLKSLRRIFTASIFPLALSPHLSSINDRGPFPLRHGDLHSENILVDEETGTIIGVIDWEGAGTVPWEVAGGLNWEVQGEIIDWLDQPQPSPKVLDGAVTRPDVHGAFNNALTELEQEMENRFRKLRKTKGARPHLEFHAPLADAKPPSSVPLPALLHSLSSTSLASSTSSSASSSSASFASFDTSPDNVSDADDASKSRSRSSSSSRSNLTSLTTPPTSPASSIFDLHTPPKEVSKKPPSVLSLVLQRPSSLLKLRGENLPSIWFPASPPPSSVVFRTNSEPPTTPSASSPTSFSRTVSLNSALAEAFREPLPADYKKQLKNELSLSFAAMAITEMANERAHMTALQSHATPLGTPFSSPTSSGPSSRPQQHRPIGLHRRKQSSMALSLPPFVSPSGSPSTPIQPLPISASLSLPPFPLRAPPSPSPSPIPSPLATPQPLTHNSYHSPFLPRTPPPLLTRSVSHQLPPSLSRNASVSASDSTSTATPPSPTMSTSKTPLSLDNPPVSSPCGRTLSELHASMGTYVASYLAHWMYGYGCEYETVGKALWDVVSSVTGDTATVDEAFWRWVKETMSVKGESEAVPQEQSSASDEGIDQSTDAGATATEEGPAPVQEVDLKEEDVAKAGVSSVELQDQTDDATVEILNGRD